MGIAAVKKKISILTGCRTADNKIIEND